jgi:hypothetical protein
LQIRKGKKKKKKQKKNKTWKKDIKTENMCWVSGDMLHNGMFILIEVCCVGLYMGAGRGSYRW